MMLNTVKRTFANPQVSNPEELIDRAKKNDNNSFVRAIKNFFNPVGVNCFGLRESLKISRSERREKEIIIVTYDILENLPKNYADLATSKKVLHTNCEKGYEIRLENERICLYSGNKSFFGKGLIINEKSQFVLFGFDSPEKFNEFKVNLNPIKNHDIYKQHIAAIKIQSMVRGFLQRRPEDKEIMVPAYRDSEKNLVGYKVDGHYISMPEKLPEPGESGRFKTHTHGDENSKYIGLTLIDLKNFTEVNKDVLTEIKKMKHIVPQYRVNKTLLISENLGSDLATLITNEKYEFNAAHFKSLLFELETLHKKEIVHRDLTVVNMGFKDGEIYLFDLDSMGKIGTFGDRAGTLEYTPKEFLKLELQNTSRYAITQDKYNFFICMMVCWCGNLPDNNGIYSSDVIIDFVKIAIKPEYRKGITDFLKNPIAYNLQGVSLCDLLK